MVQCLRKYFPGFLKISSTFLSKLVRWLVLSISFAQTPRQARPLELGSSQGRWNLEARRTQALVLRWSFPRLRWLSSLRNGFRKCLECVPWKPYRKSIMCGAPTSRPDPYHKRFDRPWSQQQKADLPEPSCGNGAMNTSTKTLPPFTDSAESWVRVIQKCLSWSKILADLVP